MSFVLVLQEGITGLETAKKRCHVFFGALGTGIAQMRAGAISRRRDSRLIFYRRGPIGFFLTWCTVDLIHTLSGYGVYFTLRSSDDLVEHTFSIQFSQMDIVHT